jgi:kynurenine formamidase
MDYSAASAFVNIRARARYAGAAAKRTYHMNTAPQTIVDLSLPLYHEMPIWSGEPKVGVFDYFKMGRVAGDPEIMNMKLLLMCGHAGTHTDAPRHLTESGWTLDDVPLSRYVGDAFVVDLSAKPAGEDFSIADFMPYAHRLTPGARMLVRTDWDRHLGTPMYFNKALMPKFTPEVMRWLNERNVGLIGMDTPSLNPYLDLHRVIFETPEPPVIVELMTNLNLLPADKLFTLICLPLKIREGDGSPVRAVALV